MIKKLLLIALLVISSVYNMNQVIATASGFNKAKTYQGKASLGRPADSSKIINYNGNTSNLQNMRDSDLSARGRGVLNGEGGRFLQKSERVKIESIDKYKINSSNSMLRNSYKIEEDPMAKTGGGVLTAQESASKTIIKKACMEGVNFDVDVGYELILDCEEEEYTTPLVTEEKVITIPGAIIYNQANNLGHSKKWKKRHFWWLLNKNQAGWRKFLSAYLEIPLEDIEEEITYPDGAKGVGISMQQVDKKSYIWKNYRLKYKQRFQDTLKRLKENGEYWQAATLDTEALSESNECYEISRTCTKSGVKRFFNKYDIERPCWYEKITYHCRSEPKDGCAHLTSQNNCRLHDSSCEYRVGGICLRWKRDFICGGQRKIVQYSLADSPIYCLGGDCHSPVLEENQDLANIAYLASVNEANKDCVKESNGVCKNPITVFPGNSQKCKKIIAGAINCCSSMKGWANRAKICRCSGEERGLALKRDKGLCHNVGTYCSKRVLGKCVEKKTSFCCFSSKISRIFQEQARMQLGRGWGSASSPNCSPLTLSEFQRLDFSKFDLEELFADLLTTGKSKAGKQFPNLEPGKVPEAQKEHMRVR